MRPGRQLAALGLIFVILYALVFFAGGKGSWRDRLEPKLGLDLVGGTRVTLIAKTLDGGAPRPDSLEQARQIIENRVNGRGVAEAEVVTEGDQNIVISVPGQTTDSVKDVGQAAQLRFRKVVNVTQDIGDSEPAATPSASATPSPGASSSASPKASAAASAKASAPAAAPSAPATPTAAASAAAAPTTAAPSGSPTAAPPPQRAEVEQKVGRIAWETATGLNAPLDPGQDPTTAGQLAPFKDLTPDEVAALPVSVQFNVPYVTCKKLDARTPGSIQNLTEQAVACEGSVKYLLDAAKVEGTDVAKADSAIDPQTSQWKVDLTFTGGGQEKWTALTREAINNDKDPKCEQAALGDQNHCLVAIVLDNEVVSAPQIISVMTSNAQITGNFTKKTADVLAQQLRYGALPVTFQAQEAQSISATLGGEHLRAGLLAAGIGMLLVIIYAFFYYRLLGSVIFLSLVLSGLLTFGMLVFLGREIGFTLTLAGIAGFIVSLGVAADSFVIYFERLKDEIRDGRSPRSAVPRAWARARRTIISANTISILAAVVLYVVSVGSVKGFAFALGMATTLDLIVVFLFRHPIMAMFAQTQAFLSPRVSGLGRVLRQGDTAGTRTTRVKEA
jgi:preprotein translocase subunit SecD